MGRSCLHKPRRMVFRNLSAMNSLRKPFDVEKAKAAFGERFVRPPPARFYFTRDSKSGKYKIVDRHLHNGMVIAIADFREAAVAIVSALNQSVQQETSSDRSSAAEPPRSAVLGDLFPAEQFSNPRFVAGVSQPPSWS